MIETLKNIFTAGGIAKTGAGMLESAFFTDQERAQFMLDYLKASAPMAIARRVIACIVALIWAVCVVVLGFLLLTESALYDAWSAMMTEHVNEPFKWVMGFYFLYKVLQK
jgi:hypothetical protein